MLLCTLLLLYMAALEGLSRTVVPKMSASLRREHADYLNTLAIEPVGKDGKPTMLVIGNSLLFQGVVRENLVSQTADAFDVSLFPVEGTTFNDWYFGMRRYFAESSRPAVLALCINARQMASNATNGEFFAHAMMQLRDYPAVIRAARLDTMTASNYLFAHWSMWLATRANVRNGLTERLLPRITELVPHFTVRAEATSSTDDEIAAQVLARVRAFRELAREHGAEFVWIVPPTMNSDDPAPRVRELAKAEGIRVLIPFPPGDMPVGAYSDGFHLNREGANLFTARLAPQLQLALKDLQ